MADRPAAERLQEPDAVRDEVGAQFAEHVTEPAVGHVLGQSQLEHKQRCGDRENAVDQREEPPVRHA